MTTKEALSKFQWTNHRHQYYGTFAANLMIFSHGTITGWLSPALAKLTSDSTILDSGPLTTEQVSWIGAINCVGFLVGSLTLYIAIARMGCKRTLIFTAIPTVGFWLLVAFGNTYYHILLARFINGWTGGGMHSSVILYISEIANNDIRGRLGTVSLFLRSTGILFSYVLGYYVDYKYVPYISIWIPIIFIFIFTMLPNTPQYYLENRQLKKAEDAVKYYKGYRGLSEDENYAIYEEFERLKMVASKRRAEEKLQLSDLWNRAAIKGIGIGIALTIFAQFTADFTIINYAALIFKQIGTTINPYVSSIISAVAHICGSLMTTYFADRLGRKLLNLVSLSGCSIGLLITSLYHYLYSSGYELSTFSWLPVVSLSFVVFFSSTGIAPLILVCSVENIPSKVRTLGLSIISFSAGMFAFVSMKLFPILMEILKLYGCFTICGIGCIVAAIFVYYVLEDTSGKSLDDVGVDRRTKSERMMNHTNYNTFNTCTKNTNSV